MTLRSGRWACASVLVGVCLLAAVSAFAATYITKTSSNTNQTFETALDPQFVDLGEGHGTSLAVRTVGPTTRLLILFNAECTVAGTTHGDFLRLEILVDGSSVPPSGGGHALCTSDGDSALDNWVTAASDVSVLVGPGTHTVQLRGSLAGLGVALDDWWIGDLSLIVIANRAVGRSPCIDSTAYALLFLGCLPLASPAWGAANAVLSESLISVDPSCDLPSYQLLGTADFTTNDDGAGNDFIAVVFHDASGAFHDVDFGAVQVPNDNIDAFSDFIVSTPPFGSFFASRPLIARVHDIPIPERSPRTPRRRSSSRVASPVIGVLTIDPATDALACLSKRFANWALRIDSMKNGGGQIVSTSPCSTSTAWARPPSPSRCPTTPRWWPCSRPSARMTRRTTCPG